MTTAEVRIDASALAAAVREAAGPEAHAALNATAAQARAIAPHRTGAYADSVQVEFNPHGETFGTVAATDPASRYIEFGTSDTPAFAPLRRAAEAVFGTEAVTR